MKHFLYVFKRYLRSLTCIHSSKTRAISLNDFFVILGVGLPVSVSLLSGKDDNDDNRPSRLGIGSGRDDDPGLGDFLRCEDMMVLPKSLR